MPLPARDTELVQIMDAAFADAALRAGDWLICRPGCTQCCVGAFAISPLDAERLRAGMKTLRLDQPALAAEITHRAHVWLDEYRTTFPGNPATGQLGTTDEELIRFEEFANDAACPTLNPATGLCDVYFARPMTCRVFGPPIQVETEADDDSDHTEPATALAHCELCFTNVPPEQVAACEMPLPHAFEATLLNELAAQGLTGETVVAFALLA